MVCITKITMIHSQFCMVIMPALILCCYSGLFIVARLSTLAIGYRCPIVGSMFIV